MKQTLLGNGKKSVIFTATLGFKSLNFSYITQLSIYQKINTGTSYRWFLLSNWLRTFFLSSLHSK